jgi:hypothetical protein
MCNLIEEEWDVFIIKCVDYVMQYKFVSILS